MAISLKMTEDTERLGARDKCLEYLRHHAVDVGLTSSASARSRFLLGIHTRGSPIMRIPPRPVVEPALNQADLRAEMGEKLMASCEAALEGNLSETKKRPRRGRAERSRRHLGIHRQPDPAAQQPGDALRRMDL